MMMKKTIEFKDVINFIDTAMAKNVHIQVVDFSAWKRITIGYNDNYISINCTNDNIEIYVKDCNSVTLEISNEEKLEMDIWCLKALKYSKNKTIYYFNSFFNTDEDNKKEITTETLDEIDGNNAE